MRQSTFMVPSWWHMVLATSTNTHPCSDRIRARRLAVLTRCLGALMEASRVSSDS